MEYTDVQSKVVSNIDGSVVLEEWLGNILEFDIWRLVFLIFPQDCILAISKIWYRA